MGVTAQAARAAAGLGPAVAQADADAPVDQPQPPLPAGAVPQQGPAEPPSGPQGPPPGLPPGLQQPPPQAPFDMAALRSFITDSINAVVQPLQTEMAALRVRGDAILRPSSPVPPLIPPPLNPLPPPPPVHDPQPPSPPPHRAAVLGGGSLADSANSLLRLLSGPDPVPSDVREVRPQSIPHTLPPLVGPAPPRFNPLPTEMIPAVAGSVQDNTQLLTSLITTFHKTAVKYSSLKALDQGLEEWWVKASRSGTWTGTQLMSVANYRAFISTTLGPNHPHHKVLEYHRLFTVAVNDGDHDMFQPGGHFVAHLFLKAGLLDSQRSSSSFSKKGGKAPDSETPTAGSPARSGGRPRNPLSGSHPAGSCTKHPTSTSHTTAECRMK
jgi:hypothetical protein